MATPTLVQFAVGSSAGTTVTATFGSANTAGNMIVAYGQVQAGSAPGTFSDPTNGTYWKMVSGAAGSQGLAIAITPVPILGSAGVTVTMGGAVAQLRLVIQEWSGLDTTNPMFVLDQALAVTTGTSATPSAGTFATLAESGELVLVLAGTGSTSSTWTAGTGFALGGESNPAGRQSEWGVVSGTNPPAPQFTIDASRAWTACAVALRSARTRKVIAVTSGSTFAAPADWPGTADRVDLIGGGGAGVSGNVATFQAPGGGGGAYTYAYNVAIANGAAVQVGSGGSTDGGNGTDTWVVSSGTALAKAGSGATAAAAGAGGLASGCIPSANAQNGGTGGTRGTGSTTSGGVGGGGAGGPYGAGVVGGTGAGTGVTGGTGGGGAGGGSVGTNQANSNQAGTAGGNSNGPTGQIASSGGTGGASGLNAGNPGVGANYNSGSGGGGGGSDGSGGGGAGGNGGNGAEFAVTGGTFVGSGGGAGAMGNQTSGSTPAAGNGGLYGGGGAGGGNGTCSAFGAGGGGLIVLTYQPAAPVVSVPGGTGSSKPARRAKIKRSKEIFQEEMAALEAQLKEATEDRLDIENTLTAAEHATGEHYDVRALIANHERTFRKDAALARIPVYIRIPQKPVGQNRVEAINRLRILAHAARYREQVASEKLRKIKEKMDTDAAVAFMQWALRDWD